MGMKMRNLKFWGRLCGQSLGIIVLGSLAWFLFAAVGGRKYAGEAEVMFLDALETFPYYLLLTGSVILLVMGTTYFQVYLPLVISMNAARKSTAIGLAGCIFGIVAGILGMCAVIWWLTPGDIARSGRILMPLLTGGLLLTAAFGLLMGMLTNKWGKAGLIIMAICFVVLGAGAGMAVALTDGDKVESSFRFLSMVNEKVGLMFLAGIVVYLLVSILIIRYIRKMEVRA